MEKISLYSGTPLEDNDIYGAVGILEEFDDASDAFISSAYQIAKDHDQMRRAFQVLVIQGKIDWDDVEVALDYGHELA